MNVTINGITTARKSISPSDKRVARIPIEFIRPNPYQPRSMFNESNLEELASSIKQYGLIQPISVRRMSEEKFEIIAGERRYRACKMLGWGMIDAIVYTAPEQDAALIALIENLQRKDLHFLEEAEAFLKLLHDHALSQDELAKRLGKSQSAVANKLRLLRLPASIRKTIIELELTERHARALLRIKEPAAQQKVIDIIQMNALNVKQTEELVEKMLDSIYGIEPEPDKPARMKAFVRDPRLFINSIQSVVSQMNDAGLKAIYDRKSDDLGITLTVFIPKNA